LGSGLYGTPKWDRNWAPIECNKCSDYIAYPDYLLPSTACPSPSLPPLPPLPTVLYHLPAASHRYQSPHLQSLSPLLQAQNGLSRLTRWVRQLQLPLQHGPLQLQIWPPFPLSAYLFLGEARQLATHLFHITFIPYPESTQASPSTFELLVSFPDHFLALRCRPPSFSLRPHVGRRVAIAATPHTSPSLPLCVVAPNLFG
jgi:hypothetical protein